MTKTALLLLILTLLISTLVVCKEQLVRHRDLSAKFEWTAAASHGFYRGPEWGQRGDIDTGKKTKSSKSNSPVPSSTKGPKSSKGTGVKSSKSPKSSKSSKHPNADGPPVDSPSNDCPEYNDLKTCTLGSGNAKECPIHSSCTPGCVPKYCKLPKNNPHKIFGYDENPTDDDRYVALGTLCGYFHYVQGRSAGRHEVEVCCDVEDDVALASNVDDDDGGNYGSCAECGACKYPQKVSDACCKISASMGELGGRAGDYSPHCGSDDRGEVCCKCGPGDDQFSYVCIEEGADCLESLCPGGPMGTTTEPLFMTMTTDQSPITINQTTTSGETPANTDEQSDAEPDEQQPMTTTGATMATTGVTDQPPVLTSDRTPENTTGDGANFRPLPPPNEGVYGLQPSCDTIDTSRFNICLDLTSTSGTYEAWFDTAISAAARWEQVIVGNLPSEGTDGLSQPPSPPGLSQDCTGFPGLIDDIYICVQNVQLDGGVVGFAGPFLTRGTDDMNARTPLGLPYAGRVGINNAALDDGVEDLTNYMIHEFAHALFFPIFLPEEEGSNLYATGTNADDAWKAIGCTGRIPIQMGAQGHWNEDCLADEIMTPIVFQNRTNPLSNITIAAMADLGYEVDYRAAEPFTIDDLGSCGSSCPGAAGNGGDGRRLELSPPARRELSDQARMAVMHDFKDDLLYFHKQLEETGFVQGQAGCYALEHIDVLMMDDTGSTYSIIVTYNDVKDL